MDFKIFKNRIWMEAIFENSIINKPSFGSREVPQKMYWRLLDTNGQTARQAKYMYRRRDQLMSIYKQIDMA